MQLLKVAVPVPLRRLFDYTYEPVGKPVVPGMRVQVSFGHRNLVGVVCECSLLGTDNRDDDDNTNDNKPKKLNAESSSSAVEEDSVSKTSEVSQLKSIEKVLDDIPTLDEHLLSFGIWISEHYVHSIGEVMSALLPGKLRKAEEFTEPQVDWVMVNKNADEDAVESLTKKQQACLDWLNAAFEESKVEKSKFTDTYSSGILKALVSKGVADIVSDDKPIESWQNNIAISPSLTPTVEQSIAITAINNHDGYAAFLVDGITGSGKTEVYLQVIEKVLNRGQQVLILVPEIGLTPQTIARFENRFGKIVASIHSGLTDLQRFQIWQRVRRNEVGIVIGTRSSIFLPMHDLGMIIVDEEHDDSFKQQDGLRYHARDIAAFRAHSLKIPLVLGSATPSLESTANVLSSKYHHLTLTKRAGSASLPTQHLFDLTGQPMKAGIAVGLLDKMRLQLEAGNQVLIFVNRRGYAPSLICHDCGAVENCEGCDYPYTVHKLANNLQCHRCGSHRAVPRRCRTCGSSNFSVEGAGTEQLEEQLSQEFPNHSCVRIDSDSTRSKLRLADMLEGIQQNKHQILIGTQILSKGHHFPNVTLAIVVNIDHLLFSADFRATEKLGQLLTQLSGRAGRANKPGEVWLQTHQPGNELLQDLLNNGYNQFSQTLMQDRKAAMLPPYSFQALIRAESEDTSKILEFLNYARSMLAQFQHANVLGPMPCLLEKKQNRYRFQLITQSQNRIYLNNVMQQVVSELESHPKSSRIRWHLDMQPQDFT